MAPSTCEPLPVLRMVPNEAWVAMVTSAGHQDWPQPQSPQGLWRAGEVTPQGQLVVSVSFPIPQELGSFYSFERQSCEREVSHPQVDCPVATMVGAGSFFQVSHVDSRGQVLEPSSAASSGSSAGSWMA